MRTRVNCCFAQNMGHSLRKHDAPKLFQVFFTQLCYSENGCTSPGQNFNLASHQCRMSSSTSSEQERGRRCKWRLVASRDPLKYTFSSLSTFVPWRRRRRGKQGLTAKEEGLSFTNGPSRRQASRSTLVKGDLKRVCSPPLFLRARRMRGKAENRKK